MALPDSTRNGEDPVFVLYCESLREITRLEKAIAEMETALPLKVASCTTLQFQADRSLLLMQLCIKHEWSPYPDQYEKQSASFKYQLKERKEETVQLETRLSNYRISLVACRQRAEVLYTHLRQEDIALLVQVSVPASKPDLPVCATEIKPDPEPRKKTRREYRRSRLP